MEKTSPAVFPRAASRVAPPRPRWGRLYLALATIGTITGAHFMVRHPMLVEAVDLMFAFALFASLAGWVHLNRVALARTDEPDAGTGRPRLRIVRSRAHANGDVRATDDGVIRLAPEYRVMLPYDFK
jgi:hypothetical protein